MQTFIAAEWTHMQQIEETHQEKCKKERRGKFLCDTEAQIFSLCLLFMIYTVYLGQILLWLWESSLLIAGVCMHVPVCMWEWQKGGQQNEPILTFSTLKMWQVCQPLFWTRVPTSNTDSFSSKLSGHFLWHIHSYNNMHHLKQILTQCKVSLNVYSICWPRVSVWF